jgi:DNA-binding NtrC family response regulator
MLGISAAIRGVEDDVEHAARAGVRVLITGERGVGKEVVARLIHDRGARRNCPLLAVNCAGLPDSLLEAELFGQVNSHFIDARRDRRGALERAHCGTLFIEEIGDASVSVQGSLLQFFETGELPHAAPGQPSRVDVRVIASSRRRLIQLVSQRAFREDLYYRLNVIHIELPPLRARREDVLILLRYFLDRFSAAYKLPLPEVTTEAARHLVEYDWPGNVRELRHVAEQVIIRSASRRVDPEFLAREVLVDTAASGAARSWLPQPIPISQALFDRIVGQGASFWDVVYAPFMARDLTRREVGELVRLGLEQTSGNLEQAATLFNVALEDRSRFLNFLRKYRCLLSVEQSGPVLRHRSKLIAS